ncbi:MAG: SdrD B-like domain-containing protein [Thiotrichaceae bacterium]
MQGRGQVTGEVFTVDGQTIGWNPQNSQYPIGIKATLNILPNPNYMWSNSCGNEPITIASPGIECTVRFTPKIVVQGNNLVCMTGLSQAKPFSWLLKNKDGTTYRQGSSTTPTIGEPPEIIAAKFSSAMGIIAASDNCIKIGNRTLFVSYPATPDDTTNMCEVTANGCQFNPTIKLVPEAQMLTTIRGFVWNDADESGLQESGESYLFNWTVLLKRPDGSEISTFTDVNGYYEFTGLSTGNYTVFAETRTGAIYTTSETETVKIDSINIPMAVSFGIKIVVPPGTAQLQVIPSDNGIVSGGIGSGMLYCGYGDNVLGPDCIVNFSTTSVPFGVVKAIPKAGYSFVTWSDPSICPNATAELCNPVLSGGKNLSLSASFKANGEPTIDPNVTIGGNVTTTPTISNVRLSSSIFEPGKQVEISWNSTGQTKYVVYLYDDSTNSLVSDAACPSNSFHPTLGSACLLYETSSNSSVKWTVPWVLPAGHYTLKVAIGNGNNWSDAVVATTPQEALTYLEITPPDNGIISGYIGSTTIYCGHDDNNVVGDKCSAPGFSANIMRILTATPKQGFVFSQWSDASICLFVTDTSCLPMTTGSTNAKLTANFTATESPKPMIRLVATKVPSTVKPGESFDITLRFTPDTAQLADGIEVYLEFDPTKLKINSVNNSGVLDFELSNQIGNNFVYFSAASMFNDVPTETFDLVTINVTALENTDNADNTTLHFVTDHSHVSSSGNYIPQDFEDIVINFALEPVLQCKVMLQGRPTPPAPSWKMELKLYVDGKQDTVMTEDLGQCQLPSSLLPLSAGTHSICVKNSHTLQKKLDVNIPLNDDLIDFGELIEGDTNDDNQLNLNDFRLIGMATNNAKKESCQGDAAYNSNADLNSDGCISIADAILFKSNLSNIVGGILLGDTCLTAKIGHLNTRDGDRDSLVSSAKVNLSIPTGISVGETFDVVVQVTGNVSQPIERNVHVSEF